MVVIYKTLSDFVGVFCCYYYLTAACLSEVCGHRGADWRLSHMEALPRAGSGAWAGWNTAVFLGDESRRVPPGDGQAERTGPSEGS